MNYFELEEFLRSDTALKNKIENLPSFEVVEHIKELTKLLNVIREKWDSAIIVNSGFRSKKLNTVVGGVKNSMHLEGKAADIVPKNGKTKALFSMIEEMIKSGEIVVGQIIDENKGSWIHISIPDEKHHNQILHIR